MDTTTAAAHLATRLQTAQTKQAFSPRDALGWLNSNPGGAPNPAHWLAAGAGLGGLAGLASSYAGDDRERRPLSSAITGALAGGAALGGGALALPQLAQFAKGYLPNSPAHTLPGGTAAEATRKTLEQAYQQGPEQFQSQLAKLRAAAPADPSALERAGKRFAVGYGAGAAGQAVGESLSNPLYRGAGQVGAERLSEAAKPLLQTGRVGRLDQLRLLGRALRNQANEAGAILPEMSGLMNTEIREIAAAGRPSLGRLLKSPTGLALGTAAALAPYLMPVRTPAVTIEDLAK